MNPISFSTRRNFLKVVGLGGAWTVTTGSGRDAARNVSEGGVPPLREVRRRVLMDALENSFKNGRLNVPGREALDEYWWLLKLEADFASLAAFEFRDPDGPLSGDVRLRDSALSGVETVTSQFRSTGRVGGGGSNTPYFALVPVTRALVTLKGHVDATRHAQYIERCEKLFAAAAVHINRPLDYLNPRALEAVSALGLHRLTGRQEYLDRCHACLDGIIARQFACGALPYHTGGPSHALSPAQGYQFLTVNLILDAGSQLKRADVIDCVRRVADYSLLATNRHGEAFCSTFIALNKSRSLGCAGRQWVMATALGDQRFRGLARTTYELWAEKALEFGPVNDDHKPSGIQVPTFNLNEALSLGVKDVPRAERFAPRAGLHALPDVSTVFVHEPGLDIAMTILGGGKNSLAEADCGSIKLFALTPEISDQPTFQDSGLRVLRENWSKPSEQFECSKENGKTRLRGRVLFPGKVARELELTLTYAAHELLLEYHAVKGGDADGSPARLLFLLVARPSSTSPKLQVGDRVIALPSADASAPYFSEMAVNTVRFSAPDGSGLEIIPEVSRARRITAERPVGENRTNETKSGRSLDYIKPANEGSVRVAFDGPDVFSQGRYRLRFRPA